LLSESTLWNALDVMASCCRSWQGLTTRVNFLALSGVVERPV
jgi:hypothetical protein